MKKTTLQAPNWTNINELLAIRMSELNTQQEKRSKTIQKIQLEKEKISTASKQKMQLKTQAKRVVTMRMPTELKTKKQVSRKKSNSTPKPDNNYEVSK